MQDKVKLPKEVAEAIEKVQADKGNTTIYSQLVDYHMNWSTDFPKMDMDTIMKALVNGYEVEQTPEDKVREMFTESVRGEVNLGKDHSESKWWRGRRMGIIDTINALGIKIEGVNTK